MKLKSLLIMLAAVAAFALSANSASAQIGGCGIGGVYGPGVFGLYGGSPYASGRIPTPPYFSLHPPVYYKGRPVARSYGYSPFPYSGNTRTPEVAVQAQMIHNPHVKPAAGKKTQIDADENRVAEVTPEVIRNPFVVGNPVQMANYEK